MPLICCRNATHRGWSWVTIHKWVEELYSNNQVWHTGTSLRIVPPSWSFLAKISFRSQAILVLSVHFFSHTLLILPSISMRLYCRFLQCCPWVMWRKLKTIGFFLFFLSLSFFIFFGFQRSLKLPCFDDQGRSEEEDEMSRSQLTGMELTIGLHRRVEVIMWCTVVDCNMAL